jgi:putative peptidoglycan lipid II flippase
MHDSRTPMYIGVAVMAINIAASLLALAVLPAGHVVEGLAAAFGLANLAGAVISWPILSRRLHGLAGRQIAGSLVRMHLAALPCLFFALAASLMVSVILPAGPAYGIVTIIIGGGGALLLYLVFAKALGITELTELTSGLRTRLRR